jgi:glycosyltransferase involved in cell wall biosynthesis
MIGVKYNNIFKNIFRKYSNIKNNIIIFPKKLPLSRLNIFLNASDVLLLPTLPYTWDIARWPGRFGDYLAVGKPIATTNLGDPASIVRLYELGVVSKSEPKFFAEGIEELLFISNKDREAIQKNARSLAEKRFSWKILTKTLSDLYSKLL